MIKKYALYPFQEEAVNFLISKRRAINGADMGLGKTLQSIAAADRVGAKKILVLAPKALLFSWKNEIEKFSDNPTCSVCIGTAAQKKKAFEATVRWYITNHETLLQIQSYPKLMQKWDLIVVDEFHNYMNRRAKKTLALKKLKSDYLFGLTGTPILTKPDQLWSQLNIIAPHNFRSFWNWVKLYCATKFNPFSGNADIVTGVLDVEKYKEMLAPYFIRHTKEEVLEDLPDKIYNEVPLQLNDKQQKLYKSMKKDMIVENGDDFYKSGTALEKLIRLRQICLDPRLLPELNITEKGVKTEALINILTSSEEQFVVFTSFKSYANLIAQELKDLGITYELLTGDTPTAERAVQVERFRAGQSRVFIGTIKAGGVGLNLQTASNLIFMDKDYSPAINAQTEARIHRIGQKNAAVITTLYTLGTVDELMEKMLAARGEMIDSVITPTMLYEALEKE